MIIFVRISHNKGPLCHFKEPLSRGNFPEQVKKNTKLDDRPEITPIRRDNREFTSTRKHLSIQSIAETKRIPAKAHNREEIFC